MAIAIILPLHRSSGATTPICSTKEVNPLYSFACYVMDCKYHSDLIDVSSCYVLSKPARTILDPKSSSL